MPVLRFLNTRMIIKYVYANSYVLFTKTDLEKEEFFFFKENTSIRLNLFLVCVCVWSLKVYILICGHFYILQYA